MYFYLYIFFLFIFIYIYDTYEIFYNLNSSFLSTLLYQFSHLWSIIDNYIICLIFCFYCFYIIKNNKITYLIYINIFYLLVFICMQLFNFIVNSNIYLLNNNLFNPLLQHFLVILHPPLILIIFLLFKIIYLQKTQNLLFIFLFFSFTIILGSYWASSLFGWGGWWSWDPIENISFIYWLLLLIQLHIKKKYLFFFTSFFLYIDYTLFYFLKFNSIQSIHIFKLISIQLQLYFLFFYISIYLLLLFYFLYKKIIINNNIIYYYFLIFLLFLYFYLYIYSFINIYIFSFCFYFLFYSFFILLCFYYFHFFLFYFFYLITIIKIYIVIYIFMYFLIIKKYNFFLYKHLIYFTLLYFLLLISNTFNEIQNYIYLYENYNIKYFISSYEFITHEITYLYKIKNDIFYFFIQKHYNIYNILEQIELFLYHTIINNFYIVIESFYIKIYKTIYFFIFILLFIIYIK